jgi:hypothetical protein
MRKICLFFIAFFLAFQVFSQSEKGFVYLKNGTIIKGKYQMHSEKIFIQSAGNLWVFEPSEIDTVTSFRQRNISLLDDFTTSSPFFFRVETGLLIGNSQNSQSAPFSFHSSMNYRVNNNFSAGLGFGAEFFKETYMPVFVNLEYKLKNSSSSPYFFLKGGYEVAIEDGGAVYYDYVIPPWSSVYYPWYSGMNNLKAKGGIMVNPGFGFSRMVAPGFGVSLAFGYQFHRLHYSASKDYGLDIDYNRLTIKIGILFN